MKGVVDFLKNMFIPYNMDAAYHQDEIELSRQHLIVIQNLQFTWLNIENGAVAGFFTRFNPIAELLKLSKYSYNFQKIMGEALCAFPLWISNSNCIAGVYVCDKDDGKSSFDFELTQKHIQLIQAIIWTKMRKNDGLIQFYFEGYPFPMPYTDGKRPFGDRIDYIEDMRKILKSDDISKEELESLFQSLDNALHVYVRHAK